MSINKPLNEKGLIISPRKTVYSILYYANCLFAIHIIIKGPWKVQEQLDVVGRGWDSNTILETTKYLKK